MGRIYATSADYQAYTGHAPDTDTDRLLGRASAMLESEIFRHCYYVADDTTGLPLHPLVAAAFSAAVCAQVEWWGEVGDSIGIGGIGTFDQVHIGTMRLMSSKSVGDVTMSAARQIAPSAVDALQSPDLTPDILRIGLVSM